MENTIARASFMLATTLDGPPQHRRAKTLRNQLRATRTVPHPKLLNVFDAQVGRIKRRLLHERHRFTRDFKREMGLLRVKLPQSITIPDRSRSLLIVVSEKVIPLSLQLRLISSHEGTTNVPSSLMALRKDAITPFFSYVVFGVTVGDNFSGVPIATTLALIHEAERRPLSVSEGIALGLVASSALPVGGGIDCALHRFADPELPDAWERSTGSLVLWRPEDTCGASIDYRPIARTDKRFSTPSCLVQPLLILAPD